MWDAVFSSFLGLCDQFMNVGGEMLSPSLGLYYLLAGLCRILGKMYAVLLVYVLFSLCGSGPLLPALRPSQDAGGDVCCSPSLGLGDFCCSPCLGLGLYYLLSGLRRMLGELYAVLLVWVWEMYAVLLLWVWASTTCFQAFARCWGM